MHKNIMIFLGIISLMHCKAQKVVDINNVDNEISTRSQEKIIYLNQNEQKFLQEFNINIAFKRISEVSRCPKDLTCKWADIAVVDIDLTGKSIQPTVIKLSTIELRKDNYHYQNTQQVNEYTFSLTEITPFPNSQEEASSSSEKYKIGISVSKGIQPNNSTMR